MSSNARDSQDSGETGGGYSEELSCSFGYSSVLGKRASMEDFYEARFVQVGDNAVGLFGVFDGHGGSRAAEYVAKHLHENLINHPLFLTDMRGAIAFQLSVDHRPDKKDERQRIEKAGGVILWAGTWRVGGVLAVSRAFGNRSLKQCVVPDPELQEVMINDDVEFLLLASDGLWDVVRNQDAVSIVQSIANAQEAARKLTDEALRRGSADNTTCIVVRFRNDTA